MLQVGCLEGHDVAVHVQGPCGVALAQEAGDECRYTARLTASGTYLAHVQINGHTLQGWPKTLHVAAAASQADKCVPAGRSLGNLFPPALKWWWGRETADLLLGSLAGRTLARQSLWVWILSDSTVVAVSCRNVVFHFLCHMGKAVVLVFI